MDSELYDAMVDLRATIIQQTKAQESTNDILRSLIATLQETAQAVADLREAIEAKS